MHASLSAGRNDCLISQSMYQIIYSMLRSEYDISILLISHDFSFVRRYADKAALIDRRLLAFGPPQEVFASETFRAVFPGVAVEEAVPDHHAHVDHHHLHGEGAKG